MSDVVIAGCCCCCWSLLQQHADRTFRNYCRRLANECVCTNSAVTFAQQQQQQPQQQQPQRPAKAAALALIINTIVLLSAVQ